MAISRGLEDKLDQQIRRTPDLIWQSVRQAFVEVLGECRLDEWLEANRIGQASNKWGWRPIIESKGPEEHFAITGVVYAIPAWKGEFSDFHMPLANCGKYDDFVSAISRKILARVEVDQTLKTEIGLMLCGEAWSNIYYHMQYVEAVLNAAAGSEATAVWMKARQAELRELLGLPVLTEGSVEDDFDDEDDGYENCDYDEGDVS